ncbi:MAG: hypothetical protein AAFU73_06935 [Planctomycetota bacterium]
MTQTLPLIAGALVAGAAAGAVVTALMGRPPAPSVAAGDVAPARSETDAQSTDSAALRALVERVERLELEPVAPAAAPMRVDAGADAALAQQVSALRAEVAELREELALLERRGGKGKDGWADAADLAPEEIAQRVREIEVAQGKRRGSLDRRVSALGSWLELDDAQSARMSEALRVQGERDNEVLRQWAEGASVETLGQVKEVNQDLLRSDLESFLSPDQLERLDSAGGLDNAAAKGTWQQGRAAGGGGGK